MAAMSSPETPPTGDAPPAAGRWWRTPWDLFLSVFTSGYRHRITGLAGELAFFALLSLPPLLFGLVGAIGFVVQTLDVTTIEAIRTGLLDGLRLVLTDDVITETIEPMLDSVLDRGRFDVLSIGFVIALWSGSRALAVLTDTIRIMYGLPAVLSYARARARSILLYVVALLVSTLMIPIALAGPDVINAVLPRRWADTVTTAYWPVTIALTSLGIATLYNVVVPLKHRWRSDLPGAALAVVIWLAGGALLRWWLGYSFGGTSLYGPLAAPIALLMVLYLLSLAVLIGAGFNAALLMVWPRFGGLSRQDLEGLDLRQPQIVTHP